MIPPDPGGWEKLAGLTCDCPPGCTIGDVWGDGPRACLPTCRPCTIMAGQPYVKKKRTKARKVKERVSIFERPLDIDEIGA